MRTLEGFLTVGRSAGKDRKLPLALIAVFIVTFLPALRATAASDETDWAQAFEKAKRESPGFAVESVEEFRKLTDHYASLLSDGVTVASFELPSGDQIHCVEISSQRSVATSGQPLQLAPGTPPAESTLTTPIRPDSSTDRPRVEFGLDGTRDAAGNERACPAQSFPKLMPRLENLYHFRRLQDLFQKTPGGGGGRPATRGAPVGLVRNSLVEPPHEYAHAYQWVNNTGMSADFNLWSPTVEQSSEFSLSQLWVARGQTTDNSLQTAETGWQNFQQLYGDSRSHLFIYYTTGNYQTGTGCYNLTCTGFVQTDNTVVIGESFTVYSTLGGPQYSISLAYFRDPSPPHNWWLKYGSTWVGYYPNSLFNSQGIANYSDRTDFGGEIVNNQTGGLHTTTQMGSGRFPSEGYGFAAVTEQIRYWDTLGNQFDAAGLNRDVTNASYYDLSLGSSTDSSVGRYFYFGGPGRVASSAPTANFTYSANPKAGQPVQFTDTSTGSPTSWSWTFGDGGASTAQNPIHTFGTGTYQVSLTVSNSGGSNTTTQAVVVSPGSGIGCTEDAYTMCLGSGRYKVTSRWRNQYVGDTVTTPMLKTDLTDVVGAFWKDAGAYQFFVSVNPATAALNGHTWVAMNTFSGVEFWIDVTDTLSGQSREYHNPPENKTLVEDRTFFVYP